MTSPFTRGQVSASEGAKPGIEILKETQLN